MWAILRNHGKKVKLKIVRMVINDRILNVLAFKYIGANRDEGPLLVTRSGLVLRNWHHPHSHRIRNDISDVHQGLLHKRIAEYAIWSVENAVLIKCNSSVPEDMAMMINKGTQNISKEFWNSNDASIIMAIFDYNECWRHS